MKNVTPEKAIDFIRASVAVGFVWPLPSTTSKRRVFVYKIMQVCSIISAWMFLLPLLYASYVNLTDPVIFSRCIVAGIAVFQCSVHTAFTIIRYEEIQHVIEEMIACVKEAQKYEREVFQDYVDQYYRFYGSSVTWFYTCIAAYAIGPVILPQPLPTDAIYPFSVDSLLPRTIVYMHQFWVGLQVAGAMSHSAFGALLLWFSAARFECLIVELRATSSARMLMNCIKKQIQLRRYANQVISCFRLSAFLAIVLSTIGLTLCCIALIMKQPILARVQSTFVFFTILLEIFMYAWPADHMKDMSMVVPEGAYESKWYNHTLSMQKDIVCMLTYRQPVTLTINGIVPELSLRFYCSYLSNAFSIFTTLRVVMDVD